MKHLTLAEFIKLAGSNLKVIDNVAKFRRNPKRDTDPIYIPGYHKKFIHRSTAVRFGLCEGIETKKLMI